MKKINLILLAFSLLFMYSCGDETSKTEENHKTEAKKEEVKKEEPKKVESSSKIDITAHSDSKGVGPNTSVEILSEVDMTLADKGKEAFKKNCTSCHKMKKRVVGPALDGVSKRRTPEWIMNMIMNPNEMVEKDPVAKALLAEYLAPMSDQSMSKDDARAILEFFRSRDNK